MSLMYPFLAQEAIVVVDDWNEVQVEVRRARWGGV